MNKIILSILFMVNLTIGWSQNKTIENILSFKTQNSGAIIDENNAVDGYYVFYQVDKINSKEREYAISLIDQNLNDIANKKFIERKNTILLGSSFNNQVTMLALLNVNEEKIVLKSFDKKANELEDIVIPTEKKSAKLIRAMHRFGSLGQVLFPINNKGFVLNISSLMGENNIKYYPTNGGQKWEYHLTQDKKYVQSLLPLSSEENYLVTVEIKRRGKKLNFKTILIDVNTGSELFSTEFDENNPKLISNSFITSEGNIAVLGQYYEPKVKIAKAQSLGLFLEVYDNSGNVLFENKMSWAKDVNEKLEVGRKSKIKDIGYIFFHDIIRTQKGDFYAIGEQYKKTANAAGIATGILSATLGGVQTSGYTQLTIDDAFVFKFNKDFRLDEIKVFEKGKSRVQNLYDFGSPQLNAFQIKAWGGFDYVYSQIDEEKDRFYANFVDYERMSGEENKFAFKSIIYDEGELSEDKIYLPNKGRKVITRPMAGKLGHVLILEYNKKEKTALLHLEKLNIK